MTIAPHLARFLADVTVDANGNIVPKSGFFSGTFGDVFHTVANLLIFITGAVSVIMIIVGGFRYVVSAGDPKAVQGAKNTILYAVIGLVIAILAFAIVNFVLSKFK